MNDLAGCVLTLVPIPQSARDLQTLEKGLTDLERSGLGHHAVPKRRTEFSAGRAAARASVERFLLMQGKPIPAGLSILRDTGEHLGRPFAACGLRTTPLPLHVSITHVDGLAAAVVSSQPIGIDLVTLEAQSETFRDEALDAIELAAWAALMGESATSTLVTCASFAGKEAALKYLGTGMGIPLLSVRVLPISRDVRETLLSPLWGRSFSLRIERTETSLTASCRIPVQHRGSANPMRHRQIGWYVIRDNQILVVVSHAPVNLTGECQVLRSSDGK